MQQEQIQHAGEPKVAVGHRGGVLEDIRPVFRFAIHSPQRRKDLTISRLKASLSRNQLRPATRSFTQPASRAV